MTIKFKSQATGDLIMLNASAKALLKALGKSADGPGILVSEDMPAALQVLRALPEPVKPEPQTAAEGDESPPQIEPSFQDEPVTLRQRAWPLIQMIERALAEGKPITWEGPPATR